MPDPRLKLAAARAGDTLLRVMGNQTLRLRMPAPAVPADPTEQLGLAAPQFQDLPLAPAAFRKARAVVSASKPGLGATTKWEILVSSIAVEKLVGSLDYDSAAVLFANAAGVLWNDDLLEILSATEIQVGDQACAYRLIVNAPPSRQT